MYVNQFVCVTAERVICRICGVLNVSQPCQHAQGLNLAKLQSTLNLNPHRQERPTKQAVGRVVSRHHNGVYEVARLSDGSFSCDCLAFLFQRGLEPFEKEGKSFASCKHVRELLGSRERFRRIRRGRMLRGPTDWQKAILLCFGATPAERLTAEQAYMVIHGLLDKQGVSYRQFTMLFRYRQKLQFLPVYAFGVEFEGFGIGQSQLAEALTRAGIETHDEHYNHQTKDHWKIVSDISINPTLPDGASSFGPFELVTPKLFGANGFGQIARALKVVNELGGKVNKSCGLHVHLDAWNYTLDDARRILRVWKKIEQPLLWKLVPPSRRNGQPCKAVDDDLIAKVDAMRSVAELYPQEPSRPQRGGISRYYSLNLSAYGRHGSIEIRLHSGSLNSEKVLSWVAFLLLLANAVRQGLTEDQLDGTWENLFEKIGMSADGAMHTIVKAKEYLLRRVAELAQESPEQAEAA